MNDRFAPIAVDHGRRSLSLPRRLMPALLALHAGEQLHSAETVAELEAGGLLVRKTLDPLVATLLAVMTGPTLLVTVESAGAHTSRLATIWGNSVRFLIWPGRKSFCYSWGICSDIIWDSSFSLIG